MLLQPRGGALAQSIGEVLAALPDAHARRRSARRRIPRRSSSRPACTRTCGDAIAELAALRADISGVLHGLDMTAGGRRHASVRGVGRDGRRARRPPSGGHGVGARARAQASRRSRCTSTSGCPTRRSAIRVANRMRVAPPAPARAVGQLAVLAGPRHRPRLGAHAAVPGVPARRHPTAVRRLRRVGRRRSTSSSARDTMPDATYIWWDVRPQPRFGTVEVRIMDAQSGLDRVGPLVALVQSLARLEATEGFARRRADRTRRRCSRRTASWRRATASTRASSTRSPRRARVARSPSCWTTVTACAPHAADARTARTSSRAVDATRRRRRRRAPAAPGRGARRARRARRGAGGRVPRSAGGRHLPGSAPIRSATVAEHPGAGASSANHSLTLERGLRVLRVLAEHPDGLSVSALASRDGDAPRRASTGCSARSWSSGSSCATRDGRHTLGVGLIELASRVRSRLQYAARPELQRLADQLEATTALTSATPTRRSSLLVVEPRADRHAHHLPRGTAPSARRRGVRDRDPRRQPAAARRARGGDRGARARLVDARSGELLEGTTGVGAPIRPATATAQAAISAVWLERRATTSPAGEQVMAAADAIAAAIG